MLQFPEIQLHKDYAQEHRFRKDMYLLKFQIANRSIADFRVTF